MNSEITLEDIAKAVTQLNQSGSKVNSHTLRKLLGKGSYTTLNEKLTDYYKNLNSPFPDELPAAPMSMTAIIANASATLWEEALKHVYDKCKDAINDAKAHVYRMESLNQALAADCDELKTKLIQEHQKLEDEREQNIARLKTDQETIDNLRLSKGRLEGEVAVLRDQNATLLNSIENLHAQLTDLGKAAVREKAALEPKNG